MRVELHPAAQRELVAAARWYAERSASVGRAFVDAIQAAVTTLAEAPLRWPETCPGYRRLVLHRFPYSVVYRCREDLILVVAVAHGRRRKRYWRRRR